VWNLFDAWNEDGTLDEILQRLRAALVDTDAIDPELWCVDGTSVRGNVINTEPDPDHVKLGMKVKLATYVVGADDNGTEAVGFGFEPV
jgi:hypothetical protein